MIFQNRRTLSTRINRGELRLRICDTVSSHYSWCVLAPTALHLVRFSTAAKCFCLTVDCAKSLDIFLFSATLLVRVERGIFCTASGSSISACPPCVDVWVCARMYPHQERHVGYKVFVCRQHLCVQRESGFPWTHEP
jgi:hypothetical protein